MGYVNACRDTECPLEGRHEAHEHMDEQEAHGPRQSAINAMPFVEGMALHYLKILPAKRRHTLYTDNFCIFCGTEDLPCVCSRDD